MVTPIDWYDANAEIVLGRYEAIPADKVHGWLADLLPAAPATILDVGAGSGRDAAWLAAKGHDVIAVEPSANMRAAAARLHPEPRNPLDRRYSAWSYRSDANRFVLRPDPVERCLDARGGQ